MRHVIVDLETWGLERGNALRSIAAVQFNPFTGTINKSTAFYQNVGLESQLAVGLTKDADTEEWWSSPSLDEARKFLEPDQATIHAALQYLDRWLRETFGDFPNCTTEEACADVRMWSRGTMDWRVLEGAYLAIERRFPFHFRMQRDTRGFFDLVEGFEGEFHAPTFEGVPHYALADALHDARCINAIFEFRNLD